MAGIPVPLRVVGRDDTQAQQQAADALHAKAYEQQQQAPPSALAGFVTDQYSLMRRHRDTPGRGWSDRLLASLRAFNGIYDVNILQEIKRFGGSNVYARLIAMKCRGTSSLLRDVYLGADKPWGLDPEADPEVPDTIVQAIASHIGEIVSAQIKAHFDAKQAQAAHDFATNVTHQMGAAQGQAPSFRGRQYPLTEFRAVTRGGNWNGPPRRACSWCAGGWTAATAASPSFARPEHDTGYLRPDA